MLIKIDELIKEVLPLLPKKRRIEAYEVWNAIPTIRRARRIDAYCLEERRGFRSHRTTSRMDYAQSNGDQTDATV
jgi:hypothetical protein